MVIAALICFAILLVAWILAPEDRTTRVPAEAEADAEREALPVAA